MEPARRGASLLGSVWPLDGCGPPLVCLALCSLSALWWLLARRLADPPSRAERLALRLWWPALLAGAALPWLAWHALSAARAEATARFTQAAAPLVAKAERAPGSVTEADLREATSAIHDALPCSPVYYEVSLARPWHRLTFANQRVAVLDSAGHTVRVTVCGEPSESCTETYHDASRERLVAAFGPVQRDQASFDGSWRLAHGGYWRWLDHAPGTRGWRLRCAASERPVLGEPEDGWEPMGGSGGEGRP